MKIIKNTLLGSLSFATVLIAGNWSGAIAENHNKLSSNADRLNVIAQPRANKD